MKINNFLQYQLTLMFLTNVVHSSIFWTYWVALSKKFHFMRKFCWLFGLKTGILNVINKDKNSTEKT